MYAIKIYKNRRQGKRNVGFRMIVSLRWGEGHRAGGNHIVRNSLLLKD